MKNKNLKPNVLLLTLAIVIQGCNKDEFAETIQTAPAISISAASVVRPELENSLMVNTGGENYNLAQSSDGSQSSTMTVAQRLIENTESVLTAFKDFDSKIKLQKLNVYQAPNFVQSLNKPTCFLKKTKPLSFFEKAINANSHLDQDITDISSGVSSNLGASVTDFKAFKFSALASSIRNMLDENKPGVAIINLYGVNNLNVDEPINLEERCYLNSAGSDFPELPNLGLERLAAKGTFSEFKPITHLRVRTNFNEVGANSGTAAVAERPEMHRITFTVYRNLKWIGPLDGLEYRSAESNVDDINCDYFTSNGAPASQSQNILCPATIPVSLNLTANATTTLVCNNFHRAHLRTTLFPSVSVEAWPSILKECQVVFRYSQKLLAQSAQPAIPGVGTTTSLKNGVIDLDFDSSFPISCDSMVSQSGSQKSFKSILSSNRSCTSINTSTLAPNVNLDVPSYKRASIDRTYNLTNLSHQRNFVQAIIFNATSLESHSPQKIIFQVGANTSPRLIEFIDLLRDAIVAYEIKNVEVIKIDLDESSTNPNIKLKQILDEFVAKNLNQSYEINIPEKNTVDKVTIDGKEVQFSISEKINGNQTKYILHLHGTDLPKVNEDSKLQVSFKAFTPKTSF
jgi:hypothetical protein